MGLFHFRGCKDLMGRAFSGPPAAVDNYKSCSRKPKQPFYKLLCRLTLVLSDALIRREAPISHVDASTLCVWSSIGIWPRILPIKILRRLFHQLGGVEGIPTGRRKREVTAMNGILRHLVRSTGNTFEDRHLHVAVRTGTYRVR